MPGLPSARGEALRAFARDRSLLFLAAGRALRSLSQSYLGVVVPLYLVGRGAGPATVGAMVTAWSGGAALLALAGGFLADRIGRKWLLLLFSVFNTVAAVAFAGNAPLWVLALAGGLGTIGRGGGPAAGGAYGPYYTAEQALVAEHAAPRLRTRIFATFSLAGSLAGVVGFAATRIPAHALFLGAIGLGAGMSLCVLPVREQAHGAPERPRAGVQLSRSTLRLLLRFGITNATNGLAVGFLGPMLVLWFHVRYGADAAAIGRIYLVIALAATVMYLFVGRIVAAIGGVVKTVVSLRLAACAMLAAMPFMPTLWWAALCYLVRMLFNSVTVPVRQSYVMGVVPAGERSRAAAISNMPSQAFAMVGPYVAGELMRSTWIGLMLELAAALQLLNAGLYWTFFRRIVPPEERPPSDSAPEPGS